MTSNHGCAGEPAIVLLSGGMDSATVLSYAHSLGYDVHALSFDYGQHAKPELERATQLAARLGIEHRILRLGLDAVGGTALVGDRVVPDAGKAVTKFGIPETYVPARNTVFLAVAMGLAETLGAYRVFIGANNMDYSGYPDCRPEYIAAFNQLAAVATAEGVSGGRRVVVEAPLMHLTKAEIVAMGVKLGVDFRLTMSCYAPTQEGLSCGRCESCVLRLKGFRDAGIADPVEYAEGTVR